MRRMKIASWNIEHFQDRLDDQDEARLSAIASEIREINADILCVIEGPWDVTKLRAWLADDRLGLGGEWELPVLPQTDAILAGDPAQAFKKLRGLYGMNGTQQATGRQWIWFLVRRDLMRQARVVFQPVTLWQTFTATPKWSYRTWPAGERKPHYHWRQPQVLRVTVDGYEIEFVGLHLKSKINQTKPFGTTPDDLLDTYVAEALDARIKLTSEVADVRRYVDARFAQEPAPRIVVMGDLNDGPGREYFEREYLHHDLLGNLQGDVFSATRFLNHALFDFDEALRWSTQFHDRVETWSRTLPNAAPVPASAFDTTRRQLIDHILFTQSLTGPGRGPKVPRQGGAVEHRVHERIQATLPARMATSDHRPVSLLIEIE